MISARMRNRYKRKLVARVGELSHGQSKKFTLRRGGRDFEAMLLNYGGNLYAYVNRCPHVGISLDWVDNQFFTVDNRYLMCANHGAVFEPPTGECVWGPCVGASLESVVLDIQEEKVFALCLVDNEECDSSPGSGK
ncbi:MAG TPA: Rieske 2Fe-2S domain-containing protein [Candidatus Binatia bacterium]